MNADSIDFTRDDIGLWLFFIIIPFLLLRYVLQPFDKGRPVEGRSRSVFRRSLVALFVTLSIMTFLAVWQRMPPQYFIKLRLEPGHVVLGFRWPEPESTIQFGEIRNVRVIESGTLRHPCSRVEIRTANETHRSYGFGKFNEDEIAVMDKLRAKIGPALAVPNQ